MGAPRGSANEAREPKDNEGAKGKRDREDRAKEKDPGEVSLAETEVATASPSPAKASPTEEADEQEEGNTDPNTEVKNNPLTDVRCREKAPSDPGTGYERSYGNPWWGGRGKDAYTPST